MSDFLEIELKEALRPAITYAINNIQNPSERKGDFSKTIVLPSSKELDKTFNHIFEINTVTNTFNANKRLPVEYFADEESQLKGYIRLNEIVINDRNKVEYHCQIIGKNGDLFSKLGDKELTDLDWSDLNHVWSRSGIINSWDIQTVVGPFALGTAYVYPLIEYGADEFTSPPTWYVKHLFPATYAKEYIDRIFSEAGKSYSSTFFDSTDFKQLIIPFNGTDILLSDDQVNDRVLKCDTVTKTITTGWSTVIFTNETLDTGANYDNTTGVYTAPSNGIYDLTTTLDLRCIFAPDGGAPSVTINKFLKAEIGIFVNGTLQGTATSLYLGDELVSIAPATTYDTGTNVPFQSDAHNTQVTISGTFGSYVVFKIPNYNDPASNRRVAFNEVQLEAGDTVEIKVKYSLKPIDGAGDLFVDSGGDFHGGTVTPTVESGKFLVNITNPSLVEDGTIDYVQVIPRDIKQKDFLKSIMNMFRLEIQPDNDDPDKYIIEPYDTFYGTDSLDWSLKLDVSQDLVFEPMGLLQASEYLYTYKDDKDYYNETYKAEYVETYGQRSGLIDNDFVKKLTKSDVIFSPTPSVQYPGVDMVLPTIIKNDENYRQTESNIRILQYGGMKSTSTPWRIMSDYDPGSNLQTEYPYAGHFDDPYNPTIDINFGLPKRLYYDSSFSDINFTNNNLFNKYHLPFLKQVAQRDSKLVSGWFYLKPVDIAKLSFRVNYFFNNAYHRLIKIENYDPNKPLTKCYFLKLLYTTPFEGTTGWVNGGDTIVGGKEDGVTIEEIVPAVKKLSLTSDNYASKTHKVYGSDNYVDDTAKSVKIQGDNNYIGANVKNINIINGDGNNIGDGVEDVTLINTDNVTVTESNTTYLNGSLIGGTGSIKKVTSDQVVDQTFLGYEATTTSNNVTLRINAGTEEGKVMSFKKIGGENHLQLLPVSTTIDGESEIYLFEDNDLVNLYWSGFEWKIR